MVGDAYLGRWARCDCNLGGEGGVLRVCGLDYPQVGGGRHDLHGGPCGPRVGGVADPLIMATDFVGWTMRLLWER